jgi:hypothetical protein
MAEALPVSLVSEVLFREHPARLLQYLVGKGSAVRYSEARKEVDLRPQEFQRALEVLENHGLVEEKAVPKQQRPANDQRAIVLLEATLLGRIAKSFEEHLPDAWTAALEANDVPPTSMPWVPA